MGMFEQRSSRYAYQMNGNKRETGRVLVEILFTHIETTNTEYICTRFSGTDDRLDNRAQMLGL